MLINGEDGSTYEGHDLGFFKSVLSASKKAVGTVGKVAVAPQLFVAKKTLSLAKPLASQTLAMVTKPFAAGQPVQEVAVGPSCGFFQRISKFFGGSPDCQ